MSPAVAVGGRRTSAIDPEPYVKVKIRLASDIDRRTIIVYAEPRRHDGIMGMVDADHPDAGQQLLEMVEHYLSLPVVRPEA